MKSLFRGYFGYSEAEFTQLWETAVFSFDTNVLLDLYRLKKSSADAFLETLKKLKGRVWLPYQVAAEFFRHHDEEIQKQFPVYQKLADHIDRIPSQFRSEFSRHPFLPLETYALWLTEVADRIRADIQKTKKSHVDPTYNDATLAALNEVFDGRVGPKVDGDELKRLIDKCKARFDAGLPPGNRDAKKEGERKYGDAILWLQLLEHAKAEGKPIILVTSEKKDDWWSVIGGRTIGPRRELVQEMHEAAGQMFYLYSTDTFLERAARLFGSVAKPEVIQDVQDVERERFEEGVTDDDPESPPTGVQWNYGYASTTLTTIEGRLSEIQKQLANAGAAIDEMPKTWHPGQVTSRLSDLQASLPSKRSCHRLRRRLMACANGIFHLPAPQQSKLLARIADIEARLNETSRDHEAVTNRIEQVASQIGR